MAGIIGLKSDDSCKDASRTSFVPMEADILYINDKIFDYDDASYEKAYGEMYRAGRSKKADGRGKKEDGRGKMADGSAPEGNHKLQTSNVKLQTYHGVPMQRICDAWILEYPKIETRHGKLLEAAARLHRPT